MKSTFVIAALLGFAAASQTSYGIIPANQEALYLKMNEAKSQSSSDSTSDDDEDVQLAGEPVDHSGEWFNPGQSKMLGSGGYVRVTTPRFAEDSDDVFTRSMIENYALEHKDFYGAPTGNFYMTKATTLAAANEVLQTHLGLHGAELAKYLDTYFDKAWSHFDVNEADEVAVVRMSAFFHFLLSDQYTQLGVHG